MFLSAAFDDYPHTLPLKRGEIRSEQVAFNFSDIRPANRVFKPMVRELRFDVSEMAIGTYVQAKAHGKPLVLLPATVMGRFQHGTLLCNAARPLAPADLPGKRVGVRSYSQTTAVWVRGILAEQYGVDMDRLHWVTFEDGHVGEYREPASRAGFARQEPVGHASAGRVGRGHLWRRSAPGPGARERHCRSGCGGTRLVRQAWRGSDQPYGGGGRKRWRNHGRIWWSKFTACWRRPSAPPGCQSRGRSTSRHSASQPAGRRCRRSLTMRCSKTSYRKKSTSTRCSTIPLATCKRRPACC